MRTPDLATEHRRPSWHNGGGKTDRSACFALTASQLLHLHEESKARGSNVRESRPLDLGPLDVGPSSAQLAAYPFLHETRTCKLNHRSLQALFNAALPFRLLGDFRTPKSNALKAPHDHRRRRVLKPTDTPWRLRDHPLDLKFSDPNKGAAAVKILPIPEGWSQSFTLQIWQQNPILRFPYLLCPACDTRRKTLFMILCTPDELSDARSLRIHIQSLDQHPLTRHKPPDGYLAGLMRRYEPLLLDNLRFVCTKCLGLRYGYARFAEEKVPGSKFQVPSPQAGPEALRRSGSNLEHGTPGYGTLRRDEWNLKLPRSRRSFSNLDLDQPTPREFAEIEAALLRLTPSTQQDRLIRRLHKIRDRYAGLNRKAGPRVQRSKIQESEPWDVGPVDVGPVARPPRRPRNPRTLRRELDFLRNFARLYGPKKGPRP